MDSDQLETALRRSSGAELPAPASFTRSFTDDSLIVLRETKGNVPGWVWVLGLGLSALFWALFVIALALALGRMGRAQSRTSAGRRPPARPAGALAAT